MKVHTGTDADSALVHTVRGTAANVADVNVLGELLHGAEESLHGDSAYHSKELKAQAEASDIEFNVNERGTKHRPLIKAQRARNRRLFASAPSSSIRSWWSSACGGTRRYATAASRRISRR